MSLLAQDHRFPIAPPAQDHSCLGTKKVIGEISKKYDQLGACKSFLGAPLNSETATSDGKGRFNHFQGGSIYWHPATGAHEVHGAIRDKWESLGWERSFLGYPTTDETATPDGKGRFNHFQGGSIYWHPATGAHEVHGAIRDRWKGLGWERSFLGYPTTDETATPDGKGRFNRFQGGSIYWHPDTGVRVGKSSEHPDLKPVYLLFSRNTVREPVTGRRFPQDMPEVRFPSGYQGCSESDKKVIREAWVYAHYHLWRADQVLDWLARNSKWREEAWGHGYNPNAKEYRNYSPRAWFGPYNGDRFDVVDSAIEKAWGRIHGKSFKVKCRVKENGGHPCYVRNPGGNGRPSANHIVYGTINFCQGFFESFDKKRSVHFRARTVVHEVSHHLLLKNSRGVVKDTHTHCDNGRCRTEKMYGGAKASHLARVRGINEGHYKRAIRNNDNYAYFAFFVGRMAYSGDLTRFPAEGFNFGS
jgi:hypothetical protein